MHLAKKIMLDTGNDGLISGSEILAVNVFGLLKVVVRENVHLLNELSSYFNKFLERTLTAESKWPWNYVPSHEVKSSKEGLGLK